MNVVIGRAGRVTFSLWIFPQEEIGMRDVYARYIRICKSLRRVSHIVEELLVDSGTKARLTSDVGVGP